MLGTHTHVPTADEQILPGGTAFISDVGMTGPYDSILGRRIDRVLSTTITFVPSAFDVATGDPRLGGALVDRRSGHGPESGHPPTHADRGATRRDDERRICHGRLKAANFLASGGVSRTAFPVRRPERKDVRFALRARESRPRQRVAAW